MNEKDNKKIKELTQELTNSKIKIKKLRNDIKNLKDILEKKPSIWRKVLTFIISIIVTGILAGILASYIAGIYFIPQYFEQQEQFKEGNLAFSLNTEETALISHDICFHYIFIGQNNFNKKWTKDVTLKLFYPENYSVSVYNVTDNPQHVIPNIQQSIVSYTWDLIDPKENNTPGILLIDFWVKMHNDNGPTTLSQENPPKYRIKVEDVGEYPIDMQGVVFFP